MRATNFNSLSAVSVLLLTIVCTTVPSWARVDITATRFGEPCDGQVIISFDATSETNLVRAFALDIRLDNDANIVAVVGLSADYWVYPGTIQITADGTISYLGTMSAEESDLPSDTLPGPPDSNGVTLEAASLYAPVGPASPNAPAKFGDLVSIFVGNDANCLTISANVARAGSTGVVMEDPNEIVQVNFPGPVCFGYDHCHGCMNCSHPAYADWVAWNNPVCWCYIKQCRGDINGTSFLGKSITLSDLNVFKAAFNQSDTVVQGIAGGICADLNHAAFLNKRVTLSDLNTFKTYFNKLEALVPECDPTNYNYWETP